MVTALLYKWKKLQVCEAIFLQRSYRNVKFYKIDINTTSTNSFIIWANGQVVEGSEVIA